MAVVWWRARLCFSPVRGTCTTQTQHITRHLRTQCNSLHLRGPTRHDAAGKHVKQRADIRSAVRGTWTPQHRHQITRHLGTQCIDFHPRGLTRYDVARKRVDQEAETRVRDQAAESRGPIPLEAQAPARGSYRDQRSIDAVDPVVLKYTNMINEMRSKASGVEKVNETHFGSIRFDEENVPHLHGQFDGEHGPDTSRGKGKRAIFHLQLESSAGRTGVVKIREQEQVENEDSSNYESQARLNPLKENRRTDNDSAKDYITDSSGESENLSSAERATNESNYIDKCMFGSSFSSRTYNEPNPPPLGPLWDAADAERSHKVDDSNVKDLNYVDEVFFKNALENLEINRQPAVDYSEIKKDLEDTLLHKDNQHPKESREDDGEVVSQDTVYGEPQIMKNDLSKNKIKEDLSTAKTTDTPKSAYEYVVKQRQEEHKKQHGLGHTPGDGSNKSYKKILSLVSEKTKDKCTRYEVLKTLKSSILYNDHDIVGLYKPYGMAMHGGADSQYHILTEYLPELAAYLKTEALYPVHRLDATTTGVVLLACTPAMANILKGMFKEHQLKKVYWAITKCVPKHMQGIIDIPIAEGMIDGRRRMVLKPDVKDLKSISTNARTAVTRFKVISNRNNVSLVELSPMTGVKHQLRVHLGFGLSCPILGDHKYSHLKKMAPQALPGDVLHSLKIQQSKVRHLPLYLHCKSIIVPEILDGKNIFIHAKLPAFFNKTLSLLKLNRHESKVRLTEPLASPP